MILPSDPENAGFPAKIRRVQLAGSIAKIELFDKGNNEIFVEMPHEKHKQYNFQANDSVFVVPKKTVVFEEDYSI
ncbi:hypothetical protein FACS1894170_11480 [Planctomycetales bacterium]|nr:hypothetical protein FACS1894170_11480 [Planctomycetales bacterium]